MTARSVSTIYGPSAYNSNTIPNQPIPKKNHIGMLSRRLPWGDAQELLPVGFVGSADPGSLKKDAEREQENLDYLEHISKTLDAVFNHERIRYTPLQSWTQLWVYMHGLGKGGVYVMTAIWLAEFIIFAPFDQEPWRNRLSTTLFLWAWTGGVAGAFWLLGYLALKFIPDRYLLSPSRKGPVWEMNRQTGMVTIFARKKGQFRKLGIEGDFIAPFYEFDAAIHTIPDRQGFPQHMLNLIHRYEGLGIDFSVLMGKVSRQQPCMALWDFWQRYMDVSQPLPDLPELEVFRHLDPTTAEHDKRTDRPERYWRDMDMATFKAKIDEITDVTKVNMDRPNIMARHVIYS